MGLIFQIFITIKIILVNFSKVVAGLFSEVEKMVIDSLKNYKFAIVVVINVIGMITFGSAKGSSISDDFSGFLRSRQQVFELNNSTPFNQGNYFKLQEWENETMANLVYSHRHGLYKLHLDVDYSYKFNKEDDHGVCNEVYFSAMNPALSLNAGIGRQMISLGTGFFVNPLETYENEKAVFEITEDRKGIDALRLSLHSEMADFLYFVQYDDNYDGNIRHHGKISQMFKNTDVAIIYSTKKNKKNVFGFTVSRYLADDLEFHVEIGSQQGRDELIPCRTPKGDFSYFAKDDSRLFVNALLGVRLMKDEEHLNTIVEYYYNSLGLSGTQYETLLDGLALINNKDMPSRLDALFVDHTYALLQNQYVKKHYLFTSIQKHYHLNTITLQLDGGLSLDDGSGMIAPKLEFLFEENFLLTTQVVFVFGDDRSEFGTSSLNGFTQIGFKYLF